MTQISEITKQESTTQKSPSQEVPRQSRLNLVLSLAKMLLKNPAVFRTFRVMGPDEERYVRPPRQYEIPPFHESMKYCTSNEKYLRPTRWCNPREPDVVAMANELGAYELPDYEFAAASLEFVKTKMTFEMCPADSVGATLRRGTGSCFHLINVWIALCRSAGIKARYKIYEIVLSEGMQSQFVVADPLILMLTDSAGGGLLEAEGEACVDGKWMVGQPVASPELHAHAGHPIAKLGETLRGVEGASDVRIDAVPGTMIHPESAPSQITRGLQILTWLAPASIERMNVDLQKKYELGRKIIEEAGGIEAYDQKTREKYRCLSPTMELSDDEALVFEE